MQSVGLGGDSDVVSLEYGEELKALFHFFNHMFTLMLVLMQP